MSGEPVGGLDRNCERALGRFRGVRYDMQGGKELNICVS